MPTYRYLASASPSDNGWTITVEGFRGVVTVAADTTAEQAAQFAAQYAALRLGVSEQQVKVHVNFYRPPASWREVCEFPLAEESRVFCRRFHGGSMMETLDAFRAWLQPFDDDTGLMGVITMQWHHYAVGEDGHAPVELEVVYHREPDAPVSDAEATASAVAAVLVTRGHPARLAPGSDQDVAMVVLDEAPHWLFEVGPEDGARLWSAVRVDENGERTHYAGSPVDALRSGASPDEVADMILAHVTVTEVAKYEAWRSPAPPAHWSGGAGDLPP